MLFIIVANYVNLDYKLNFRYLRLSRTSRKAFEDFRNLVTMPGQTVHEITPSQVHVRGLPFKVPCKEILQLFSPLQPTEIKLGWAPSGRETRDEIIDFGDVNNAVESLGKNKSYIGKR